MEIIKQVKKIVREFFLIPVYLYRIFVSPFLPSSCIYSPSCSQYTLISVKKHGIFKGTILAALRILRCHGSFFHGGNDPVPEVFSFKKIKNDYSIRRIRKDKKTQL